MRTSEPSQSTDRMKSRNACCVFDATWETDSTSPKAMWRACASSNSSVASFVRAKAATVFMSNGTLASSSMSGISTSGSTSAKPSSCIHCSRPGTFGAGVIITHPVLAGTTTYAPIQCSEPWRGATFG